MKASMRTVPIASKKLFIAGPLGRLDASEVRTEPVAHVTALDPTTLDAPPLLYRSEDPAVPILFPAVLFVGAW
jgi:hypothetical protein